MRLARGVAATLSLFLVSSAHAHAQDVDLFGANDTPPPASSGECVGERCFAGVFADEGVDGAGSGADPCAYVVGDFDVVVDHVNAYLVTDVGGDIAGVEPDAAALLRPWVVVHCPSSRFGNAPVLWAVIQLGDPPEPALVARVAEQAVVLPVPAAIFSPGIDDFQIVGLETWLWLDPAQTRPISATACIQPADYACVDVRAALDGVEADMADGTDPLRCDGPGTPYDEQLAFADQRQLPHCGHVYTNAPTDGRYYPVQVTSTWHVTYSCRYDTDLDGSHESSCGSGDLGVVARVGPPELLEVRDLQAVATG